ncbi:hypothetical protein EV424DRAFT_1538939 [Suillus variegatus]|nr:hypothetical protein EV424DRAFT_1538939 [Suillus variegatus]
MSNVTAADTALNVFGDVAFIDIQNAISIDNTYFFNLNVDSPGLKTIVFRIGSQKPATIFNTSNNSAGADDSATESEPEDEGNSNSGDDMEMQTDDVEVRTNVMVVEDEVIGPDFQPVVASLCNLLTRRTGNPNPDPENPTAPWSYYIKQKIEEPDSDDQEEEDGSTASV